MNGSPRPQSRNSLGQTIYTAMRENAGRAMQLQGELGKWLIASVILLHMGALVALLQSDQLAAVLHGGAGWYFIVGIVLILICGFSTWIALDLNVRYYEYYADVRLITDDFTVLSTRYPYLTMIRVVYGVAVLTGFLSVMAFIVGAYAVYSAVTNEAHAL